MYLEFNRLLVNFLAWAKSFLDLNIPLLKLEKEHYDWLSAL